METTSSASLTGVEGFMTGLISAKGSVPGSILTVTVSGEGRAEGAIPRISASAAGEEDARRLDWRCLWRELNHEL